MVFVSAFRKQPWNWGLRDLGLVLILVHTSCVTLSNHLTSLSSNSGL